MTFYSYNPLLVRALGAPPSLCVMVNNYTEVSVALYLLSQLTSSSFSPSVLSLSLPSLTPFSFDLQRYKINPRTDLAKWAKHQPTDKLSKDSVKQELLG